nr:hypothetical protein [Tanacetum cinerariifolium]
YLTASRPDIMFTVCACARHQVTPKECHLHGVKRIFRYLKGHLKLGLWYPKESPFVLVAYSDSDYGGATQDRKSAIEGCQFLGRRLISLQYKKQTIIATSTTEVEQAMRGSIKGNYIIYTTFFWSTTRIETTNEGTKILATVDGKPRTISESSIKRNLKLKDEAGISSLPDAELFKNLTLMGYNISPNQKFSFQKGQFSHQWKYLIHTIMQCLSPKSTGFNEFSSNIATALVCLATNKVYNFSKMIFDGEGSGTPTEPYHTPSPEAPQSLQHDLSSSIHLPVSTATIPTVIPTDTPPLRQYTRRARIAQSSDLPTVADEPASPFGDDNLEIASLKAIIKLLEDRDGGGHEPFREDATIKGRSLKTGQEACIERSTDKGSNDIEEMVNVLTSLDAASVLSSGVQVSVLLAAAVATISVPPSIISVPTSSDVVPTASPIFTTTIVATPYSRRKGKEKMVESETPKKKSYKNRWMCKWLEEELQMMIDGLDRSNEMIAKHLQEYEQVAAELTIREKLDLINELVKYQDHLASILKQFKGMSLEEIREKFVLVWKQIEDFVPMGSKEEGERFKRKGLSLEQVSAKKVKTSEEVSEEDLKTMMQLVPVKEVYVDALQHFDREDLNQLWTLVKETLNIRQATSDKEKELWVDLKRDPTTEEDCTASEDKDALAEVHNPDNIDNNMIDQGMQARPSSE